MSKVINNKYTAGGSRWPDDRLIIALRLIAFLPTVPGATVSEMLEHLQVTKPRLYALIKAVRESDIEIMSEFSPQGHKLYWIGKQDQGLADKLL